jgi:hypothetical protein
VVTQIAIIGQAEFGHGTDAGTGVSQHAEHGAIAEADDVIRVDRLNSVRACSIASSAVLPSVTLYLRPRTEAKGLSATAWRWTSASKKCLSAASAWFLVGAEPGSWLMYSPARPGVTWRSSNPRSSHQPRKRPAMRP